MSSGETKPKRPDALPGWVSGTIVVLAAIVLLCWAWVYKAENMPERKPRIDLIYGMDNQIKFKAQTANPAFADGRAMRLPPEGTIARGQLKDDDDFFRGQKDGQWTTEIPLELTMENMNRGQERFGIYCAPCHGLAGNGDGMVARRADELQQATWVPPVSMHDPRVRNMHVGQLFHTITYGVRTMPAYGPQIPEKDRWAIVMYIRALQRSRSTSVDDVPQQYRDALQQ